MFQIRQLSLGGVLDQGIAIIKARFGLLMSIVLVTVVPVQLVSGMAMLTLLPGLVDGDPKYLVENMGTFYAVILGTAAVTLVVLPLANAAVIHAVSSIYLSQPTTLGDCLRHGVRRWPALIGTTILQTIMIMLGTLALIIPGIIFAFRYLLAQQVAVLEPLAGSPALKRSRALMKGNFGAAFVLLLIVGVINGAGGAGIGFIPQPHLRIVGQSLLAGVSTVFGAAVLVVFYFSNRCKLENFDLVMLAEAVADDGQPADGR
jgi:hypothetical protein